MGNGQFTLDGQLSTAVYSFPCRGEPRQPPGGGTSLFLASLTPTVFSIVGKFYGEGVTAPSLQRGEVALFKGCNYSTSDFGTWIFITNVQDLSPFTFGGRELNNAVGSVKVGPQTSALLYPDANYGGQVQVITEDTPCLTRTPIGSGTSSFKFTSLP